MRKTYEVYFRAGNEPLRFMHCLFAEHDNEVIKEAARLIDTLLKYEGVERQVIVKYGCKQVANFTF